MCKRLNVLSKRRKCCGSVKLEQFQKTQLKSILNDFITFSDKLYIDMSVKNEKCLNSFLYYLICIDATENME